ncbi:MAG: glycoside hydrolase family 3 protein [Rickettsia sp.]|nr:glycoside hydrolase family 3 protein [Rickettsia sp.]
MSKLLKKILLFFFLFICCQNHNFANNQENSEIDKQEIIPIIFGISGPHLTKEEKKLFQKYRVKGFILYKRNIESSNQLKKLIKNLRSLYDYPIMIFTDQEGGKVTNIVENISKHHFPSQGQIGSNYFSDYESTMQKARQNYINLAQSLKNLGFDSGLSPVCDISYDMNSFIGNRSFGSNINQVIDLSREAISAMLDYSIIPVLKHAPGHGKTSIDSHKMLPIIKDSLESLEKKDFKIFKTLVKEFEDFNIFLMSSHIIYESLDPISPITISKNGINYIRNNIGFQNIILSDAIDMFAIHPTEVIEKLKVKIQELALKYYLINKNTKEINYFSLLHNKKIASEIEFFEEKKLFNESLLKVAKKSLDAGCDIILHCSGKIKETKYILENF